jgi:CO/xanthine dehydrogenase Mo-binding subunit
MNGSSLPKVGPGALRAEQARLARFFESINKHRKALDLAIADNFGGELDPAEWRRSFESSEPHDANRTMVVTGDHSAMLNAYVEILKASAGARLMGLLPHRRPHADQVFEALVEDGGLTMDQAKLLKEVYAVEGRLEHASPDVDAEEVLTAIERFREALPGLVEATVSWLRNSGIELG